MYDSAIFNKIQLLSYVIDDIKQLDHDMKETTDPALLMEYREEMKSLVEELNSVTGRVLTLLEVYLNGCKETNEPINLDYYRVYKELSRAVK